MVRLELRLQNYTINSILIMEIQTTESLSKFLDPEGGSQEATLVVVVVVGIGSLRVQKNL